MNTKVFGEKISTLRRSKGLTQAQLAEILNVSNKTISRWETGEGYPEITLLAPLAKALDVSVDQLLSDSDSDTQHQNSGRHTNQKYDFFNFGSKEYKHKEIPVEWPGLPFGNLRLNKLNILSNILHLAYYAVFTFIMIDASEYLQYTDMSSNSGLGNQHLGNFGSGNFFTGSSGTIWLAAMAAAFIFLMIFDIICMKKKKISGGIVYRNIGITVISTIAVFTFGISYCTGRSGFYSSVGIVYNKIYEYKASNLFNFDFVKLEPVIIAICGIAACSIYVLSELIRLIIHNRSARQFRQTEPKERWKTNYFVFWRSLTIFNKIALICVLVNLVIIIISLLLIIPTGYLSAISIILVLPANIARAGLLIGIIGLVLGLFDIYDRQNKCSILLILINIVLMYLLPILTAVITMLLGMTYTGVIDTVINTI